MSVLDKLNEIEKIDKTDLLKNIEELPLQCEKAWAEIKKLPLPSYYFGAKKVVIVGMGGSAIGADLAKSFAFKKSSVPIFVLRDYDLPGFVDRDTLLIAVSYSGNTEEVISCIDQALSTRAKLVGITTGGELEKIASNRKLPFYKFEYKTEPRQALGFLFTAILGILNKVAVINIDDNEFKEIILLLKGLNSKIKVDVPTSKNEAKKIANQIQSKIPVIFASGTLKSVGLRFKTQLNENSKHAAFNEEIPEACHNFVIGLENPTNLAETIFCLFLSSKYDNPRNKVRFSILQEILSKKKILHEELLVDPSISPLAEMFMFILLLDYVSFYTAMLNKTDPRPIENISYLKKRLKEI